MRVFPVSPDWRFAILHAIEKFRTTAGIMLGLVALSLVGFGITGCQLRRQELAAHRRPMWRKSINKDISYCIDGLLCNEEYRKKYADHLNKQLPRIPRMKRYEDFAAFS